jgi:hypothetical protein
MSKSRTSHSGLSHSSKSVKVVDRRPDGVIGCSDREGGGGERSGVSTPPSPPSSPPSSTPSSTPSESSADGKSPANGFFFKDEGDPIIGEGLV